MHTSNYRHIYTNRLILCLTPIDESGIVLLHIATQNIAHLLISEDGSKTLRMLISEQERNYTLWQQAAFNLLAQYNPD